MANKKVSQLTSKPSVLVTDLFPIADPTTGQLFKTTISDLGTAIGSGVSSVNTLVGAVVLDTDDIQELASPTNKYFTDTRARAALSASSPLVYNSGTGAFSIPAATTSVNGYLTSADWTTFNAKQAALSGTGFVKISGTTISYDNSTYLTTASAASTYLALAGGTMTGAIVGTTASFLMSGSGIALGVTGSGTGDAIKITHSSGRAFTLNSSGSGFGILINNDTASTSAPFTIQKQGASVITLTDTGAGTFNSSLTASSFVKTSGTSAQFLKADGSVDSSTYALDSVVVKLAGTQTITGDKAFTLAPTFDAGAGFKNPSGLYNYITATDTGWKMPVNFNKEHIFVLNTSTAYTYTFPSATGTLALTSDLGAYLPLAGGTLTGALNGTSALFSSAVRANNPSEGATGEGLIAGQSFKIDGTGTSQRAVMYMVSNVLSDTYASGLTAQFGNFAGDKGFAFNLNTSGGYELYVKNTTWNKALTISNTNAVTLTGALSGTSASFSSTLSASTTTLTASANTYAGGALRLNSFTGGTSIYLTSNGGFFALSNGGAADHLLIASTGAATFSSSVTAGGIIYGTNGTTDPTAGTNAGTTLAYNGNSANNNYSTGLAGIRNSAYDIFFQTGAANGGGYRWYIGTSEKMTMSSAGNVGIGTASIINAISGTETVLKISNSNAASLYLEVTGVRAYANYVGANGSLVWYDITAATPRMALTSGGDLLVGKTSSNWTIVGLQTEINGKTLGVTNSSAGDNNLFLRKNGIAGNVAAFYYDSTLVGSIAITSVLTTYNTTSDYRLKEDLKPIKGLELVNKIKVYDYKWKSEDSRMDGVLAHELAEVLPYAVTGIKDGKDMQSVDYSKIVPVMVQAIKEEDAKIIALQNKVSQLETEIQKLKNK